MSKTPMNLQQELVGHDLYPQTGTWWGEPFLPVERLSPPISPAENLFRYYRGEDYEWVPDLSADLLEVTPDCIPDLVACGYEGGLDNFGVKWIPVGDGTELPAFVEPGFRLLDDIADWESLTWPDVDSWEWEKYASEFREAHKDDDRLRRGALCSGYFERLISIMTFEGAAMALITDPESVTAFFDKLTLMNMKIMDHYYQDFGCRSFIIYDDWSSQRAPFFSLKMASELLAPQIRKLTDYAHEQGCIFTLHSCGNGYGLIPAMKAAGLDAWQCQENAIDPKTYEECGDELHFETFLVLPENIRGQELEDYLESTIRKYCTAHRGLPCIFDYDFDRLPETRRLTYQIDRKLAIENTRK